MEEGSIWLYIISLAALVALSAYFSASETAFSTVNRIRLKKLAKEGNKKASRALKIADRFDSAISTILIGNNIVNIAAASIGTLLFTGLMGPSGAGVSTLVMTVVVLIFGEVMPKSVANEYSESFAMFSAGALSVLMKVFSPFVWCFAKLKKALSKKLAGPMGEAASQPSVTEEELKVIIDEIQDEGVLEEQESDLVQSALEFDEICVNEVLTPRVDVVGVELGDSIESIRDLFFAERYSRLPVYEKNIDNIVGILNQQEFIMRLVKGQRFQVADILQRALYVPPTKKISVLLGELQREKLHMAVVTDQYGGTLGIVTIEDLLEELVGDIWDEHEEITYAVIPLGEHTYEVDGDLNVYDMLDKLGFDSSRFDFESGSVSGWVLERLEHIPAQGEQFSFENLDVTVTQVDEQRINKITVHVNPLPEGEEE